MNAEAFYSLTGPNPGVGLDRDRTPSPSARSGARCQHLRLPAGRGRLDDDNDRVLDADHAACRVGEQALAAVPGVPAGKKARRTPRDLGRCSEIGIVEDSQIPIDVGPAASEEVPCRIARFKEVRGHR